MPFGIPINAAQVNAVTDYCDATSSDLHDLIAAVITPLSSQIEHIESTLAYIVRAVVKETTRMSTTLSKSAIAELEQVAQTLDYMATNTAAYTQALQQNVIESPAGPIYSQVMNSTAPPATVPSSPVSQIPVRLSYTSTSTSSPTNISYETIYEQAAQSSWALSQAKGVDRATALATATADSYAAGIGSGSSPSDAAALSAQAVVSLVCGEQSSTGGGAPANIGAGNTGQGSTIEVIPGITRTAPPPPPPPFQPLRSRATTQSEQYDNIVIPDPPRGASGFPCPTAPAIIAGIGAPMGSAEWCETTDKILQFFGDVGTALSKWLDSVVTPESWEAWVDSWHVPDDWSDYVKPLINGLKSLLATVLKITGKAIQIVVDIVKCAWYYTRVVTPTKNPEAFFGLLVVLNILDWINNSRVGSQSYLGFTLGTSISIPHLYHVCNTLMAYLAPNEIPDIVDVRRAWLRGYITDPNQVECLMRLNGRNPGTEWTYFLAEQEQLSTMETIQYARRNGATTEQQIQSLRDLGWTDKRIAAARVQLYDELPSVEDHLHWLQRNVFDEAYVRDYNLLDGFEERFWSKFGPDLTAQGYTKDRARYEYAAHWIQPAPQQMLEFVYRLRPGKDGVTAPFTVADYERILAEQDYSPLARKWFAQTAYKVPALSYLRDMHRMGLLSDKKMQSYHADLGYTDDDSRRFVQVDSFRRQRQRASQGSGWSPAAMRKALAVSQITPEFARERMAGMGYEEQDTQDLIDRSKSDLAYRVLSRSISTQLSQSIAQVRQAISVGVMDTPAATAALTSLGFPAERAQGIVALQSAQAQVARVKSAVGRVRHAFADGEVDAEYAIHALQTLGISALAIEQYISVWTVEQTPGRKRLTAKQTVDYYVAGDIDLEDAQARLHNLGYTEVDIALWIGRANKKIGAAKVKDEMRDHLRNLDEKEIEGGQEKNATP